MSKTCELETLESRQEQLGLSARCSQSTVFQGGVVDEPYVWEDEGTEERWSIFKGR